MRLHLVILFALTTPASVRRQAEAVLAPIMKAHGGELEIGEFHAINSDLRPRFIKGVRSWASPDETRLPFEDVTASPDDAT